MAKPPQSDLVQIKFRARDELRAQLQAAADSKQTSVNAEIIDRLQRSFERDVSLEEALHSPVTVTIAKLILLAMYMATLSGIEML